MTNSTNFLASESVDICVKMYGVKVKVIKKRNTEIQEAEKCTVVQ